MCFAVCACPCMSTCFLTPESVTRLADQSSERGSGAAFQALLASAAEAVRGSARRVREAESAALCLAQQDAAASIAQDLDRVAAALRSGLSAQGRCLVSDGAAPSYSLRGLLRSRRDALKVRARSSPSWFSAIQDAVKSLGESAEHMETLCAGQPDESSAHELGDDVAALLRHHEKALRSEIARFGD